MSQKEDFGWRAQRGVVEDENVHAFYGSGGLSPLTVNPFFMEDEAGRHTWFVKRARFAMDSKALQEVERDPTRAIFINGASTSTWASGMA